MSKRYRISQGIAAITRRQNPETGNTEILLARRAKTLRYMGGSWSLPVGHVEPLESPSQAMAREIEEELGVTVVPNKLKPLLTVHTPSEPGEGPEGQRTDIYFEAMIADIEGEFKNMEPDHCDEIGWFPEDKLPDNFMPRQRSALIHIKAGLTTLKKAGRGELTHSRSSFPNSNSCISLMESISNLVVLTTLKHRYCKMRP
jgi:8-oxo-dGTP diphosphatase